VNVALCTARTTLCVAERRAACYVAEMGRRVAQSLKSSAKPVSTALRLQPVSEAVAALLRERGRLVHRIGQKQKELERQRESNASIAREMAARMHPLVMERARLVEEVQRLFDELLAEGRLSKTARKKVAGILRAIEDSGEIDPIEPEPPSSPWGSEAPFDGFAPRQSQPEATVPSARHAGAQPGNDTLKRLFRRLTVALHPDRVQQESEQKRRTDVMKEVTRAYEEGNLARLIEIEQLWMAGGTVTNGADGADSADAKRLQLERALRELKQQLKGLGDELRDLRRNAPLTVVFGVRTTRRTNTVVELDAMIALADKDLEPLREICRFVREFSERRISLAAFLRGPAALQHGFEMAEELLESILGDIENAPPSASKRRRTKSTPRRGGIYEDVPF
jgi:hypothetical protein